MSLFTQVQDEDEDNSRLDRQEERLRDQQDVVRERNILRWIRRGNRWLRVGVLIVAIALVGLFGWLVADKFFLQGAFFEKTAITEVKGELVVAKLVCTDECKWLWTINVSETEVINPGVAVLSAPDADNNYTFEIYDSKCNNYVQTIPVSQYQSGPMTIYEYKITITDVVIYYSELIGSSGLPELYAAVH